jgi:hypothetical protein
MEELASTNYLLSDRLFLSFIHVVFDRLLILTDMVCKTCYSFGVIVCHHSEGIANMGLQQHRILTSLCFRNYRCYF